MKFKVKKETELYNEFIKVKKEIRDARKEARDLVKTMGFDEYYEKSFCLAGGISAVRAKSEKPVNYAYAFGTRDKEAIIPKKIKANKEILQRIENLPTVSYERINDLINYDGRRSIEITERGGKRISFIPGVTFKEDHILIDVPEFVEYEPIKDMIEITTSEYKTLIK